MLTEPNGSPLLPGLSGAPELVLAPLPKRRQFHGSRVRTSQGHAGPLLALGEPVVVVGCGIILGFSDELASKAERTLFLRA